MTCMTRYWHSRLVSQCARDQVDRLALIRFSTGVHRLVPADSLLDRTLAWGAELIGVYRPTVPLAWLEDDLNEPGVAHD